jgi:hypothetical protein
MGRHRLSRKMADIEETAFQLTVDQGVFGLVHLGSGRRVLNASVKVSIIPSTLLNISTAVHVCRKRAGTESVPWFVNARLIKSNIQQR